MKTRPLIQKREQVVVRGRDDRLYFYVRATHPMEREEVERDRMYCSLCQRDVSPTEPGAVLTQDKPFGNSDGQFYFVCSDCCRALGKIGGTAP